MCQLVHSILKMPLTPSQASSAYGQYCAVDDVVYAAEVRWLALGDSSKRRPHNCGECVAHQGLIRRPTSGIGLEKYWRGAA